mgnify:CR=1 FL=1
MHDEYDGKIPLVQIYWLDCSTIHWFSFFINFLMIRVSFLWYGIHRSNCVWRESYSMRKKKNNVWSDAFHSLIFTYSLCFCSVFYSCSIWSFNSGWSNQERYGKNSWFITWFVCFRKSRFHGCVSIWSVFSCRFHLLFFSYWWIGFQVNHYLFQ